MAGGGVYGVEDGGGGEGWGRGMRVLVVGAAGGVGSAATQVVREKVGSGGGWWRFVRGRGEGGGGGVGG